MREKAMKQLVKVMKALSDPSRVKILKMLEKKKMCVCELRAVLGLAQPTVSKHLRILEEAGLVASEKDRLWVNYCLSNGESSVYAAEMLDKLGTWLQGDSEIAMIHRMLPTIDRSTISRQ
jgi:ArsR family transcriptional regulator, arsenate/arsenite/antimonite-responsive transcriptional repressor